MDFLFTWAMLWAFGLILHGAWLLVEDAQERHRRGIKRDKYKDCY